MPSQVSRIVALTTFLGVSSLSMHSEVSAAGGWYVGAGGGVSRLAPETDGSNFTLEEEASTAMGLYLGLDVLDWMGIEAAFTELGEAGLSGEVDVSYAAVSLGGVAYLLGETEAQYRQRGWSGYLRLGVSKIDNESDVVLSEENNTAVWLGAGFQWPLSHSWGLRTELNSYDGDAQALMASVYWRPTAERQRSRPERVVDRPSPSVAKPTIAQPPSEVATPSEPRPTVPMQTSTDSACAVPANGEPLDRNGCALFSGVREGVNFIGDTATLTAPAEGVLRELASALKQYPSLPVEVRVHTQSYSAQGRDMRIARERVLAVARYLVGQGVAVKRLKARALGASQPRATNETAAGRALNNRVELRLP